MSGQGSSSTFFLFGFHCHPVGTRQISKRYCFTVEKAFKMQSESGIMNPLLTAHAIRKGNHRTRKLTSIEANQSSDDVRVKRKVSHSKFQKQ